MTAQPPIYRGRFAPTPSGPLHLGSLLTALASFLAARHQRGAWLLRIDDLDSARVVPGAESRILRQLEAHGLEWDGSPRLQSAHLQQYRDGLESLRRQGLTYACRCSRAVLANQSLPAPDGSIYAGTCRELHLQAQDDHATRLRVPDEDVSFVDHCQGLQTRRLSADIGDFVLQRRDGVIGYQIACAIDEHAQGITEVLRGADLLSSTFMQTLVMRLLRLRIPDYRHVAVLTDSQQRKFSKQNHTLAIDETQAGANLLRCLDLLGQRPPPILARAPVGPIITWAIAHWDAQKLPRRPTLEIRSL